MVRGSARISAIASASFLFDHTFESIEHTDPLPSVEKVHNPLTVDSACTFLYWVVQLLAGQAMWVLPGVRLGVEQCVH